MRFRSILTAGLVAHLSCAVLVAQTSDAPANRPSFADFLAAVRAEALSRGIREEILDQALADIDEPSAIVLERDRTQAETVLSLEQYIDRRVTPKVIATGREMMARHHDLLETIGHQYGVPPSIVVAIWGFESNFGRFSGVRPTITALATLAWDPRRSTLFRAELFDALAILNRGDIEFSKLRGSWAGAMGQVQFMPSSYLKFAEDFDGDGRRDIWSSQPDVLASIANYVHGHGWTAGASWGREVHLPKEAAGRIAAHVAHRAGTCRATRDMTVALPIKEWKTLGVRLPNGGALLAADPDASLVSGATRHFLVSRNYDALLDYNCSHSYAVSIGLLADQIGSSAAPSAAAQPHKPASRRHRARTHQG